MSGWIKIHRNLFDEHRDLSRNANTLCVFIWLLQNVTYRAIWETWKGKRLRLNPGQLILKVKDIRSFYEEEISEKQVRLSLKKLEERGTISMEKGNRGALVTIENWERYQSYDDVDGNTEGDQREIKGNSEGTQREHRADSPIIKKKEGKKERRFTKNFSQTAVAVVDTQVEVSTSPEHILSKTEQNKIVKKEKQEAKSHQAWLGYSDAFQKRYGVAPTRDMWTSKNLCDFCDVVPQEFHYAVAAFYVAHNNRWYIQKGHNTRYLKEDAVKLFTEFRTGTKVTTQTATQTEAADHNLSVVQKFINKNRERNVE